MTILGGFGGGAGGAGGRGGAGAGGGPAAPGKGGSGIPFITEREFESEVLRSELPVLIQFTADWCQPCKAIAPEVEAFARRMAESRRPVRIRDEHWMFYVRERFRGEVAVGTAAECADTECVKRWHVANPR